MAMHPIDGGKAASATADALARLWTAEEASGDKPWGGSAGGGSGGVDWGDDGGRSGSADDSRSLPEDDPGVRRFYVGLGDRAGFAPSPAAGSPPDGPDASSGTAGSAPSATLVEDFGNVSPAHAGPPGVDSLAKGSGGSRPGGGGHGGSGGGSTYPQTVTYGSSGLVFNITYDSSVGSAPTGFVTGFAKAISYFQATFNEPVTINLDVGWGEVAGQRLPFGALGESSTNIFQVGYSDLEQAMSPNLPSTDPIAGSHYYWVPSAEEKALRLPGANNGSLDGAVGFSSGVSWNFGGGSGYDFVSVAEHEISETMGRIALLGATISDGTVNYPNGYTPLDLFRYSAQGTRSLVGGQAAYFSADGGISSGSLGTKTYFNSTAGGDWGDWQSSGANSAGNDAYNAFASSGVLYAPSATDKTVMNVLGYSSPTT